MDYRDSFYLFGADAKQIPIIPRHGAPTEDTEGAIGLLCMDVSAPGAPMYKCVEVTEDDKYIWVPFISDYNQNDPTQPDYIKNRPFYESEAQIMSEDIPSDFGLPFLNTQFPEGDYNIGDVLKLQLTNNDTGEVFEEYVIIDVLHDNGFPSFSKTINVIIFDAGNSPGNIVCTTNGENGNFSFKIFKEVAVPIDEKFLPKSVITKKNVGDYVSHTVPYIYGSYDEPVRVETLPSGVYILHGMFLTSLDAPIYDFYDDPNLCIVRNTGPIQLTWFNTAVAESGPTAFARFMFIQEGEILFDNSAPLC